MSRQSKFQNPNTRLTELEEIAERASLETATVNTSDGPQEMTMRELAFRQLQKSAVAGGSHASRHYHDRIDRIEEKRQAQIDHDLAFWIPRREALYKQYADHNAKHGRDPEGYPHPDDIEIDYETGVRINGPVCDEDVRKIVENRKYVRAFLLQDALEQRSKPNGDDCRSQLGGPLFLATLMNQTIPKRYRIGEAPFRQMMMRYDSTSKRELLKLTYAAWKDLGVNMRRGQFLAPAAEVGRVTKALYEFNAKVLDKKPKGADLERMCLAFIEDEIV